MAGGSPGSACELLFVIMHPRKQQMLDGPVLYMGFRRKQATGAEPVSGMQVMQVALKAS